MRWAALILVLVAGRVWAGAPGRPRVQRLSVLDARGDVTADLWGAPDAQLQAELESLLQARRPFAMAVEEARLSLVLVDLAEPDSPVAAMINPDWETFPASLAKIVILLGVVDTARATGRADELATLRPALDRMIKRSSNEDAAALFSWAGFAGIERALRRHRLYDPQLGGLWWTPSARYPASAREGLSIAATTRQVARYFLLMEQGRLVSQRDSRTIKSVLHNAGLALFSKGIQKRFKDTQYYGKPGILGTNIAEGMVIESPRARYILAIVVKGLDHEDPAFQELGQALHAMMVDRRDRRPGPAASARDDRKIGSSDTPLRAGANATVGLGGSSDTPSGAGANAHADGSTDTPKHPSGSTGYSLSATGETLWLRGGATPVGLRFSAHARYASGTHEEATVGWRRSSEALTAEVQTRSTRWELSVGNGGEVRASVTYLKPGEVNSAWVELRVDGKRVRALDAAYRVRAPPVRVGPLTPQVVSVDDLTLVARAQALEVSDDPSGAVVRLELENARAHPFLVWTECVKEETFKPVVTRPPRIDRSAVSVTAGARQELTLQLIPGSSTVPVPLRYPDGYRAAIAFADHADQSTAAKLGALMYGKATGRNPSAERGKRRGFANRGLTMTKAVFAFPSRGYPHQMDDPRFVELLEALAGDGIEIASHSATGDPDPPERTRAGLERMTRFRPTTWVDHQPTTNCEALTNVGGPLTVRQLASEGYRYAWAGRDDRRSRRLNLFEPGRTEVNTPPLYRHPLAEGLWLFSSRWMALERGSFLSRYTDRELNRLEQERGLHIAHTYLDIYQESGTALDGWTLLRKIPGGYQLTDEADRFFARLQQRQRRHRLWVTTVRRLADHLLAVADVTWRVEGDELVLRSARPVKGFSLLEPGGTVRVLDLPAGETRLRYGSLLGHSVIVEEVTATSRTAAGPRAGGW